MADIDCLSRVALILSVVAVIVVTGSRSLDGQEIQINGVPVVTTATDQDTTYTAGDGLVLDGQEFSSALAGQTCKPGATLVGFDADANILCACVPGLGLTECPAACVDLLTDDTNCGGCGVTCTDPYSCHGGSCKECSVVHQTCTVAGQGCYVMLATGEADCGYEFLENPPAKQGDPCTYINGCTRGYGCVLVVYGGDGLECARFCDPNDLWGPNGHARCKADVGADFVCVRSSDFYGGGYEDSDWYGFCIGPEWQ